jgi:hypothetical protein
MTDARSSGLIFGVLILVQMVGAILVNFFLTAPLFGSPGFLVAAAAHAQQIGLSVLLGIILGALSIVMAIIAFPIFRQHSGRLALLFVAISVGGFSVSVVEQISVMSMVSLSNAYAAVGASQQELFEGLRGVVAAARNWAHYSSLIIGGGTLMVLYSVLFRFKLVPRALAAFGLFAVALQLTSVSMPLFGHDVVFQMLAPLGLSQLALSIWLMIKGFAD